VKIRSHLLPFAVRHDATFKRLSVKAAFYCGRRSIADREGARLLARAHAFSTYKRKTD
jgi:hypothetical protein